MCSSAFGQLLLDPRDVEEDAAVRGAAPRLHFAVDAARDVIARQQLRRTARVLVALRVAPSFLRIRGRLRLVVVGDVVEHEAAAFAVLQDAAFAANAFGDENAADARRPHHPGGMELDELHVDQLGASAIGERVAVAGSFPAVARDLVGAPGAAGREDDGLRGEEMEAAALAVVGHRAGGAAAVEQQLDDGVLHVDGDPEVDGVVLQRANQLEARAVADVRQPRIAMTAEVALVDASVRRAVEHRAPAFELADAIRRFLRVDFGHPPVVRRTGRRASCRRSARASCRDRRCCAMAAAMPPSAMTVCALPSSDLQIRPTETPAFAASIAARSPAPPAPMTRTS